MPETSLVLQPNIEKVEDLDSLPPAANTNVRVPDKVPTVKEALLADRIATNLMEGVKLSRKLAEIAADPIFGKVQEAFYSRRGDQEIPHPRFARTFLKNTLPAFILNASRQNTVSQNLVAPQILGQPLKVDKGIAVEALLMIVEHYIEVLKMRLQLLDLNELQQ